jgi:hypothetical protein
MMMRSLSPGAGNPNNRQARLLAEDSARLRQLAVIRRANLNTEQPSDLGGKVR